jgi:response regulator RpfG family c-di-GMP phosphodiesterase
MKKSAGNILVIDDDKSVRLSLKFILQNRYDVYLAASAFEGMFCCVENSIDVIMMDIRMPGRDGLSALRDIKKKYPLIEVILITAYASLETIKQALRFGAFDYLVKPFDRDEISSSLERAFVSRTTNLAIKKDHDILFESKLCLEDQVIQAKQNMLSAYESSMQSALLSIHSRDNYTFDHSRRVSSLAVGIARTMELTSDEAEWVRCSASMHDIGKLGVDDDALKNRSNLTPPQIEEMKKHPQLGAELLSTVPFLKDGVDSILHHHERWDGEGYPDGLAGEEIPLGARIIAVADAIDAMTYSRYREGYCSEQIRSEMEKYSNRQFDPGIINIILKESRLI